MFRLFLILIFLLNFANFSFSTDYNKRDYNLLNNKLTIYIKNNELNKQIFKQIQKRLAIIQSVLDTSKSDSFVSRFNRMEKYSEISLPDLFVDSFKILVNFKEISKGKFDPTTFSVIASSTKLEKVNFLLNSDLYDKCISLDNVEKKISNVFFKTQSCTKISFDSIIEGIVVEDIKYFLEKNNVTSYMINFGTTFHRRDFDDSKNNQSGKSFLSESTIKKLSAVGVNINSIDSFSYLNNFKKNKIKTYYIDAKKNIVSFQNNIFVIIASDSPANNNILANVYNLSDFKNKKYDNVHNLEIPILIIYEDRKLTKVIFSKKFEKYLYEDNVN